MLYIMVYLVREQVYNTLLKGAPQFTPLSLVSIFNVGGFLSEK